MISLFSTIRKTLINEGKTSKYIRYAVGEVVLIMVGILLALQVQTWNQTRHERALEKEYLNRLIVELRTDVETMRKAIEMGERKVESLEAIIQALRDPSGVRKDPNTARPSTAYSYHRPNLQLTTFQELSATGHLRLINNDSVRFNLVRHYTRAQEHFLRLNERRTRLPWMVNGIFPERSQDPLRVNKRFFTESHVEERLNRLLSYDYQELIFQELSYSESIISISTLILELTEALLTELEEYQKTIN